MADFQMIGTYEYKDNSFRALRVIGSIHALSVLRGILSFGPEEGTNLRLILGEEASK